MTHSSARPLVASGMLLGVGMGGSLDGIVLHQLLQFHNMLSARYPPTSVVHLEVNMFWDGLFHLLTWIITAAGLAALWRTSRNKTAVYSTPVLIGSLAVGWGMFNLVEGVINHHIFHIHHVREVQNHLVWDIAFLAFGAALVGLGILIIRSSRPIESDAIRSNDRAEN